MGLHLLERVEAHFKEKNPSFTEPITVHRPGILVAINQGKCAHMYPNMSKSLVPGISRGKFRSIPIREIKSQFYLIMRHK